MFFFDAGRLTSETATLISRGSTCSLQSEVIAKRKSILAASPYSFSIRRKARSNFRCQAVGVAVRHV
jgi:hypothetical protein